MTTAILHLAPLLVVGLFLLSGALAAAGQQSRGTDKGVAWSSAGALLAAVLGGAAAALNGGGSEPFALFRLDALATVMLLLIAFLGFIILRYSQNYLDGDAKRSRFLALLSLTLAAVSLLVTTDNLVLFGGAWLATSALVHSLLLFRRERPQARVAARKKFIFARTGDIALVLALILLGREFGTLSIAEIAATAPNASLNLALVFVCGLMVIAALLKCAQFPTHGWLTEVMETPTPVSALLHAGIVNAGGFLLIRFSDVLIMSPGAMTALMLVGGFSALFGAIAMLPQTTVKGSLAHSTVAQMGFMLFQCGLGVFSAAALHLVAHSLYKAHAFLSSGRAVNSVAARVRTPLPGPALIIGGLVLSLTAYFGVAALMPETEAKSPQILVLGVVFIAGLFVYVVSVARLPGAILTAIAVTIAAAFSYHALQAAAAVILAGVVAPVPIPGTAALVAMTILLAAFFLVALGQVGGLPVGRAFASKAYVHIARGFYANAWNDRVIGALRLRKTS
ncbi:MAG: proton-conducting transporter membrane subunit [Parvularcula sp.]|nr:proton-conducting transporter membrane subunit [Parvularcula sp.]